MFGGMEIFAVDAIFCKKTNQAWILEVNDSSIGLGPDFLEEDLHLMKNLAIERMKQEILKKQQKNSEIKPEGNATSANKEQSSADTINLQNEIGTLKFKLANAEQKLKSNMNLLKRIMPIALSVILVLLIAIWLKK